MNQRHVAACVCNQLLPAGIPYDYCMVLTQHAHKLAGPKPLMKTGDPAGSLGTYTQGSTYKVTCLYKRQRTEMASCRCGRCWRFLTGSPFQRLRRRMPPLINEVLRLEGDLARMGGQVEELSGT